MKTDEEKKKKKVTCEISGLSVNLAKLQLSCTAKIKGEIASREENRKWSIEDATANVSIVSVPIHELIGRVLTGWFWVRKIQDVLRKGSISEARTRLNKPYDWTTEVSTRKEAQKAPPEIVVERAIGLMSAEQIAIILAKFNPDGTLKSTTPTEIPTETK